MEHGRHTPQVKTAAPPELVRLARLALGMPDDARPSDVLRASLARVAGVSVADFTPALGRRPQKPEASQMRSKALSSPDRSQTLPESVPAGSDVLVSAEGTG
jgi:hypothetical protein